MATQILDGQVVEMTPAQAQELERARSVAASGLQPPPIQITYKADVWRRATLEEAAVIDDELNKLNVRLRRLWDDSTELHHNAPEFELLRQAMVARFGEEEATRLLAPSNV